MNTNNLFAVYICGVLPGYYVQMTKALDWNQCIEQYGQLLKKNPKAGYFCGKISSCSQKNISTL